MTHLWLRCYRLIFSDMRTWRFRNLNGATYHAQMER